MTTDTPNTLPLLDNKVMDPSELPQHRIKPNSGGAQQTEFTAEGGSNVLKLLINNSSLFILNMK